MFLKSRKRICTLLLLLPTPFTLMATGYYGDGGYIDAALGIRYDNNLSRANNGADIEEDMVVGLSAGAGYLKKLDNNSQLLISAYLAHERFAEFSDLNNVAVNAAIVYTIQPQAGYTQPWYMLSVHVAKLQFNQSDIRDSLIVTTRLAAGKRLTDRIIAKLGYQYERRYSEAEVFDTGRHELDLELIYAYSSSISLFGHYTAQRGEVVSTARPNPAIISAAKSVAADDVFAPGFGSGCANRRCAYRLDALGHVFEAGMEIGLTASMSLDLSGRYFIIDGDGLDAYRGWVYQAGIYMQF